MKKKFLFIQPFYFYGGHFFQSFNNLIKNLSNFKNYEFLVSINNNLNDKVFKKDFNEIKKKNKIYTYNSSLKTDSKINVIKAFFKALSLRKKFDVIFFYDVHIFLLSYLYFIFKLFLKKK